MNKLFALLGSSVLLALLALRAEAQIKGFTLEELMRTADRAVHGEIVATRTFRAGGSAPGEALYYTTITLEGRALGDARPVTVDVTFRGGFVSETEGVFNSEAPAADDVKLGRRVVAFYRWSDDLGGGVPANALVAAHGGLYRVVEGPRGAAVLGRGEGYAIRANVRVSELDVAVQRLARR